MKHLREVCVIGEIAVIPLTGGFSATIDVADLHRVDQWNWHTKRRFNSRGELVSCYARRKSGQGFVYMHHAILPLKRGNELDHIDGNGLNNCRSNLRYATKAQNQYNSRAQSNNTSGAKGVSWIKAAGLWRAQIQANGKRYYLGYYSTREGAHAAYCEASARLHQDFGRVA